jgi:hypothetical protein
MKAAFLFATLGTALTWYLATQVLGWDWTFVPRGVFVANLAGFSSLLSTLAMERNPAAKATIVKNTLRTWSFITLYYMGVFCVLLPEMREVRPLAMLFLPLLLTTGIMMPLFGWVQDRLIARVQRLSSAQAS